MIEVKNCLKEVFNRVPNWTEQFQIAQLPLIEAICPKLDEAAKQRGFKWDYNRQAWIKKDKGESFDFPTIKLIEPRQRYRAMVSYEKRQLAKDWGFVWHGDRKSWERSMSAEAVSLMPFPVVVIEPDEAMTMTNDGYFF